MRYGLTKRKDERMTDPLDLQLELECKYCEYEETITVHEADYISWHNGEFIQDADRKSTRLNSSHSQQSRMPSSA